MERSGDDNKNILNYLDLNINIEQDGLHISEYNKTDDFNFNVVSLTYPHSNIPLDVGYNVFYSLILRFGHIFTELNKFTNHLHKIFLILIKRGYDRVKRINIIKKNNNVFRKFNIIDDLSIVDNLPL
jgi:hypothetical protein